MADGRPRSNSTRILQILPQTVKIFRLSWPESSGSGDKADSGAVVSEKDIATNVYVVEERRLEELKQEAGLALDQVNDYAETLFFLDNESNRMRNSPARSWQGSTSNERTPRVGPSDASRQPRSSRAVETDTNPYRQDSAYESIRAFQDDIPSVDADIQAGNLRARERVEILRGRVLRTRRTINEKRQELQTFRERFRDATDKLMRIVNEFMVLENGRNREALFPYYEEVRSAQDQLGPAEDDYDILEVRLNREEVELEQEEAFFYRFNNIVLRPFPDDRLDAPLSPLIKPYEPEDAEYENLDLDNELVKQYLATVAEADHLGEQLDALEEEQYQLSQELSFRTRHQIPISERTTTFLFEFPQLHKELVQQLHDVEDNLYELRDRCVAEQLFTLSEHVYVPRNALIEEINESMNDARDRSPLRSAVLHHNTSAHLQELDFSDKQDYVNTWMLGWVQDSSLDTLRLKDFIYSEYPKGAKQLQDDEWSELALDFWDRDKAGISANQKPVLSTIDALLGGTESSEGGEGSSLMDPGHGSFGDAYIVGSEVPSYTVQRIDHGTQQDEVSSDLGLIIRMAPSLPEK
jgi:hypothetical protein